MISLHFAPTKSDYVKSFRTFYLARWVFWVIFLFFSGALFLCISTASIRGEFGLGLQIILPFISLFVPVSVLLAIFIIHPLIVGNRVEKDERLSSPLTVDLDEETLIFKNQFIETKMDWGSFNKVLESKSHFLLIHSVNKNMFQVLPKRALTSEADEQVFRELLKQKIPNHQKSNFDLNSLFVIIVLIMILFICGLIFIALVLYNRYLQPV